MPTINWCVGHNFITLFFLNASHPKHVIVGLIQNQQSITHKLNDDIDADPGSATQ